MYELSFYSAGCNVVMLSFVHFLLKERLQIRIVPPGNVGCIEEKGTQHRATSLGQKPFAMNGSAALMHSAVEPNVRNKFLRRGEAVNVSNVSNEGSRANRTNTGDGLQEFLIGGLRLYKTLFHLFEVFFKRSAKSWEDAFEFFVCGFLILLLNVYHIPTF